MMVRSLSIKPLSQISPKTPLSIKLPSPSNVLEIDTPPPPLPRAYQRISSMVNELKNGRVQLSDRFKELRPVVHYPFGEKRQKCVPNEKDSLHIPPAGLEFGQLLAVPPAWPGNGGTVRCFWNDIHTSKSSFTVWPWDLREIEIA